MIRKETLRRNALPLALGGGALFLLMLFLGIGMLAVIGGQNRSGENPPSQNRLPMAATGPEGTQSDSDQITVADDQRDETGGPPPSDSGNVAPGYAPPSYSAPDAGGEADPGGYWDRQRSQDQRAQAFSNSMRGNDTIRDTGNGEVSTVSNTEADTAIARGEASEVPTPQLPTSYDSGSAGAGTGSSASTGE